MSEIDHSPCREEVLRAEIERLREIDRLREAAFNAYAEQERKDRAEIERLRAEVRRSDLYARENQAEMGAEIERLRSQRCGSRVMAMGDVIGECQLCTDYQIENERLRVLCRQLARFADGHELREPFASELRALREEAGK